MLLPSVPQLQSDFGNLFAACREVCLVTLFGSCARGQTHENSDIDVLVWLHPQSPWSRHDLWDWFDRETQGFTYASRVSLIPKRWATTLSIETLLLDLPEEHIPLHDPHGLFGALKSAVETWRRKNGSCKIPSFNGTHAWLYNSDPQKRLADIDFSLEVPHVP